MTHVDLKWFSAVNDLFEGNTDGKLPEIPERDIEDVGLRLTWEAFAELTFLSRFGRTLENTGRLCLGIDASLLRQAGQGLAADVGERLGSLFEDADSDACTWFLLGIVHRMMHDGAIRIDPDGLDPIRGLARSNGSWVGMVRSRNNWPRPSRIQSHAPASPCCPASTDGTSSHPSAMPAHRPGGIPTGRASACRPGPTSRATSLKTSTSWPSGTWKRAALRNRFNQPASPPSGHCGRAHHG